jgi:hypothetical protein
LCQLAHSGGMADVSLGGQQDRGSKASRSLQYRLLNGLGPLIDECLSCQPSSALLLLSGKDLSRFGGLCIDKSTFSIVVVAAAYGKPSNLQKSHSRAGLCHFRRTFMHPSPVGPIDPFAVPLIHTIFISIEGFGESRPCTSAQNSLLP